MEDEEESDEEKENEEDVGSLRISAHTRERISANARKRDTYHTYTHTELVFLSFCLAVYLSLFLSSFFFSSFSIFSFFIYFLKKISY